MQKAEKARKRKNVQKERLAALKLQKHPAVRINLPAVMTNQKQPKCNCLLDECIAFHIWKAFLFIAIAGKAGRVYLCFAGKAGRVF